MADPRTKPMTPAEVEYLLKATLHGPPPQKTIYRMMATLAEWKDLPERFKRAQKAARKAGDFVHWLESTGWAEKDEATIPLPSTVIKQAMETIEGLLAALKEGEDR